MTYKMHLCVKQPDMYTSQSVTACVCFSSNRVADGRGAVLNLALELLPNLDTESLATMALITHSL